MWISEGSEVLCTFLAGPVLKCDNLSSRVEMPSLLEED